MKENNVDKTLTNDNDNKNINGNDTEHDNDNDNNGSIRNISSIDDGIINLSIKPSVSVQSLKLIQKSSSNNGNKSSSSSLQLSPSSPSPSPPPSSPSPNDIKKKSFNNNNNYNNIHINNDNNSIRKKSLSNADLLEMNALLIDDNDQQEIQAKYSKCHNIKEDVNQCLMKLRALRETESQALKRAKKIKDELCDIFESTKESPSKKYIKEEPNIIHLNANALMLPNYCGVNTNDNSIQASESCHSASSGSVLSAFDLNYMAIECLDDIKILMQEEEKAKEKLAVVMGILDKTEDIKSQLASLDKSFATSVASMNHTNAP